MAETLPALLERNRDEIKVLLPKYLDLDRFIANARAVASDYKLKDCSAESLYRCCLEAARKGWEVGGSSKHCAVVPFKTKKGGVTAILLPQWQGKAFTWSKSGALRKLKTDVVYEGDEFSIESGDEDRIVHRPNYLAKRSASWLNSLDNIVGAYAIAWLTNGERVHAFVSRSQIVRVMENVKKKNEGELGFGWQDWLPEMCKKTAIHRLDGVIQPPPDMTPEQLEAWQRSSVMDKTFDAEITGGETPDDLPTPKGVEAVRDADGAGRAEASHAGSEHASKEAGLVPPSSQAATSRSGGADDRLLNDQEQQDIQDWRKENRIRPSALVQATYEFTCESRGDPNKGTNDLVDVLLSEREPLKVYLKARQWTPSELMP